MLACERATQEKENEKDQHALCMRTAKLMTCLRGRVSLCLCLCSVVFILVGGWLCVSSVFGFLFAMQISRMQDRHVDLLKSKSSADVRPSTQLDSTIMRDMKSIDSRYHASATEVGVDEGQRREKGM